MQFIFVSLGIEQPGAQLQVSEQQTDTNSKGQYRTYKKRAEIKQQIAWITN